MPTVYKRLFKYVPREKYLAYIGIFLAALSPIAIVYAYYRIYSFLKALVIENDAIKAQQTAFVIAGLLILGFTLYFSSVFITHILGFRLEANLRKKGIDGLATASFRFFDKNASGLVRKTIDDNASQTHTIVAHLIPDNASALLTPFMVLALGFFISPRVGFVLLGITLLSVVILASMMGEQKFLKAYQASLEKLSAESVEYVRGMQVIKIFKADVTSFKALHEAIIDYSKYALDYSMSCKVPYVLYQLFIFGLIPVLVPFIIWFIDLQNNPKQLGIELIMILFLSGIIAVSFMRIMYVSMFSFMGINAVDKLEKIFDDMQKDRLQFGTREHFDNFDIEFKNVSFGYTDTPVIKDLSFRLPEKRSYALVGSSGSGKSTIAKLISGFYKLDEGQILIGGYPLESYSENAIIQNIAFVFQDSKLFKTSIFENVKRGNPEASDQEVMQALHLAGCDSILNKLKDREHTIIGSKGIHLSGGEKQRVAIARAILKNANIIIMDEASAAVDPENEHELQKAFANLMKDKTVLMIAHRLSSIRKVDEILVLENGQVIERGADTELMKENTRYRQFQELYGMANDWRVCYEK